MTIIPGWALLAVSLLYMGGLFAIAWWGDRSRFYPNHTPLRPAIDTLALAVYGSSWTFYGAVGTALRDGYFYIAGYIGPLLLLAARLSRADDTLQGELRVPGAGGLQHEMGG